MTAHTAAGILYETDMRLRPSGASGLLVSHIDAWEEYQMEKAWTWEHQALVRARGFLVIPRSWAALRKFDSECWPGPGRVVYSKKRCRICGSECAGSTAGEGYPSFT